MKKVLIALVAILAALAVGVPAAGATDNGFYTYAGVKNQPAPPGIGSTMSVVINMKSVEMNNSGHAAGWIGVVGLDGSMCGQTSLPKPWIQAGISAYSSTGPEFYVEYHLQNRACANYFKLGPVPQLNTNYTVSIKHVGNGQWKPTVDGATLQPSDDPGVIASDGTVTVGGTMAGANITTEGYNVPSTSETNGMDFVFSSISPWTTSQLGPPWEESNVNDSILNVTTHSFESTQIPYNGSCEPQCQAPPP